MYLVKQPQSLKSYDACEQSLIERLAGGPLMLGGGELDLYRLKSERLEDEGIVMRCGLTPTDIMHIRGDFCRHDRAASVLGARYLLKALAPVRGQRRRFGAVLRRDLRPGLRKAV